MLLAFFQWLERRNNIKALKKAGTLVPSSLVIGPGVVIEIAKGAKIKIGPNVKIGSHSSIRVYKDGKLEIAAKSEVGARVSIVCGKSVTIMPNAQIGDGAIITDVDPIFGGPSPEYSIQSVTVQENGYISPNAFYGKKPGRSLSRGRPNESGEEQPEMVHRRDNRGDRGDRGGHRRDNRGDRDHRGGGGGRDNRGPRRDRGGNNFRDRQDTNRDRPMPDHHAHENTEPQNASDRNRLSVPGDESMAIGPIVDNNE